MALYLVTGATGHLGINLVYELLRLNHQVFALVLPNDRLRFHLPNEVRVFYGDILKPETVRPMFEAAGKQPIRVIHCAGIVTTHSNYNPLAYAVNVDGTTHMLKLAQAFHVEKFIYISSVHALKVLKKGFTIAEEQRVPQSMIVGFYGKTKAEATERAFAAYAHHGLNVSIVFPSGIIGPNDYALGHTTNLIKDAANLKMNLWIQGGFDFVDVRDVVQGILACSERGRAGEGYVLSNRFISFRDLMKEVDEAMQQHPIRPWIPNLLMILGLPVMWAYYKIMRKKPLLTRYALYSIHANSQFSNEKAQRELGFKNRPFHETIRDTVAWLQAQHFVKAKPSRVDATTP